MKKTARPPASTTIPAEPGWENLAWFEGRLIATRIIAWRIETEIVSCDDPDHINHLATHVEAIGADGFSSGCAEWAAFRDPSGRIFQSATRVFRDEGELIAELRERDQHPDSEPPPRRLH